MLTAKVECQWMTGWRGVLNVARGRRQRMPMGEDILLIELLLFVYIAEDILGMYHILS